MPDDTPLCPVCHEKLQKEERLAGSFPVPIGARRAEYPGAGEVLKRGRMRAEKIRGQAVIVQDIYIWTGDYKGEWAPFCCQHCAARHGVQAWRQQTYAAPQEVPSGDTGLALRFERLGSKVLEGKVEAEPQAGRVRAEHPSKLSPERAAVLRRLWPDASVSRAQILKEINKLPGEPYARATTIHNLANKLGLPTQRRAAYVENHKNTDKLTPEREALFRKLWPDMNVTARSIMGELNKLPGKPYSGTGTMHALARRLGLPQSRTEAYSNITYLKKSA
jgi:hypothetical protein